MAASPSSPEVDQVATLLQHASNGDVEAVRQILDEGFDVNCTDYDGRTALHLAASEGNYGVVDLLLNRNAKVNPVDRWDDTPLVNAQRYAKGDDRKQEEFQKVQDRLARASRQVINEIDKKREEQREELEQLEQLEQLKEEYEIDIEELNLDEAKIIGIGSYGQVNLANWRGTKVAAKTILKRLAKRQEIIKEFKMELLLLQSLRHPNIVEFLGAVTKNNDLVIVTEYLAKGDLHEIIERRGRIPAKDAVSYSLDIARGMNYLHQHKPKAIVHRDLKPRNLLQDEAGHLKVADFGLSKLMAPRLREEDYGIYGTTGASDMTGGTGTYRYMAPEVFLHKSYDKSVDVFSFAIIVTEMFEGGPGLLSSTGHDVAQKRAQADRRPEFRTKTYPPGMKDLLRQCWDKNPAVRPTFEDIIDKLEKMLEDLQTTRWMPKPMLTGAVSTISLKWRNFQQRTFHRVGGLSRSDATLLSRIDEGKSIRIGGSSLRGGSESRLGHHPSTASSRRAASTDEGSVSTFGRSDDSSISGSML